MAHISNEFKKLVVSSMVITFLASFFLILLFLFQRAPDFLLDQPIRMLWIVFAFISGFFMVGSTSVYPLAIHISTIDNENQKSKSYSKLLAFSIATLVILSLIGLALPKISGMSFFDKFDFSKVSALLYVVLGFLVYIISLSKLNVLPLFDVIVSKNFSVITKKFGSIFGISVFVLLSFFAEVVPSTWLLFMESGLGQNIKYGLILLSSHAIGRIIFVFAMHSIASFGVDSSLWLSERKTSFKNGLSVATIIFSSIIISHGFLQVCSGLSGFAFNIYELAKSGWLIAIMLIIPLWAKFFIEESRVHGSPKKDVFIIKSKIKELEDETHHLYNLNKDGSKTILGYIERLRKKISELSLISKVLESSLRHGSINSIRSNYNHREEEIRLRYRLIESIFLTLILVTILSIFSLN